MPRPAWSHSSSWDLPSSPFVRRIPGSRQRSKLFIPPPPLSQSPLTFTRTSCGRRVRSKRFTPPLRRHSARQSSAELGFISLLNLESIAHPSLTASSISCTTSGPIVSGYAEPSLLSFESTASSTLCGSSLRVDAPVSIPRKFILRADAAVFVPRTCTAPDFRSCRFTLRADAPVFVPRSSPPSLHAHAPVFVPRPSLLRPDAPVFVPRSSVRLRANAAVFVPRRSRLGADASTFVPRGSLSTSAHTFSLPNDNLFPPGLPPPIRPNSDPRVNRVPPDTATLPRVSSTLNRDAWAYFLRDYPDRDFVESLLHIIEHGADIGFTGDRLASQTSRNLPSAFEHPDAITSAIATQLSKGRIAGPFSEPPFPQFRSSPLGVAVRKRSGKLRQIHHLSWPRGRSVNDGIADSEAAMSYDMFQRAVDDLIQSGKGSQMIKLDLEQAFRHIPIRPSDWPLLGYSWEGSFYYELFLMFGLRSAPYIFNLFSEALHWILQHHIPARIRHYLDDFLKIFRPYTPPHILHAALSWTRSLAHALGLNFQDSKVEGPTTVLEYLGIILDSIRMEARLPADKLTYLGELLEQWSAKSHCTLHELAELTGYLMFCSQVIPYSRAFLRSMFDFSSTFKSSFSRRRISRSVGAI